MDFLNVYTENCQQSKEKSLQQFSNENRSLLKMCEYKILHKKEKKDDKYRAVSRKLDIPR